MRKTEAPPPKGWRYIYLVSAEPVAGGNRVVEN